MTAERECRLCNRGLIFIDGDATSRRCHVHATDDQRALVATLDESAPRIGLKESHESWLWGRRYDWPYGPNLSVPARSRLIVWALENKLHEARPVRRCPLHWLEGRSCGRSVLDCLQNGEDWRDHMTLWTKSGKPHLILTQPYQVTEQDRRDISGLIFDADVMAGLPVAGVVREETGWYGYGARWVEVRRRG